MAKASPPCLSTLPVDSVLPALCHDLAQGGNAVLCAPPGAGKTTRTPLALWQAPWMHDKSLIMLEPRRLAAKAAARYMAAALGQPCGHSVGYRMRLESSFSAHTRILVVTEGVLTRMLQEDPALEGVGCIIFDEYHQRSLHADTGLAFCLDTQSALRPDLRLLVMSATLDSEAVAALLGQCPVHISEGRTWSVDIQYTAPPPRLSLEQHTATVIRHALRENEGSVLAFLPGTAEIRRVESMLQDLPLEVTVYPLYGDLPPDLQDQAIGPCLPPQRKVVLATAIAETSLTIEGVRVVVDAGLARTAVYDPSTGMGHLVTGRVSLAEAAQRAGRAGRTQPGVAYRLWPEGENQNLRPFARPEILEADLAPLLLQCLLWGVTRATDLSWLDIPPASALEEAAQTLHSLGAVDAQGRLTSHGRQLAHMPLHPRLAHMVLCGAQMGHGALAACLAALLEGRLPSRGGVDMEGHVAALTSSAHGPGLHKIREHALRLAQNLPGVKQSRKDIFAEAASNSAHAGSLLALAWPLRVAQKVGEGQFKLRQGRMVYLSVHDSLARQPFLAVAALDGQASQARVHVAASLSEEALHHLFGQEIERSELVCWDSKSEAVLARTQQKLGALLLHDAPLARPSAHAMGAAMLQGIREKGLRELPWTDELRQWQARVGWMRRLEGEDWPKVDHVALTENLEHWLLPFLHGITRRCQWRQVDLCAALHSMLDWNLQRRLDKEMPTHIHVPSGSCLGVDYMPASGPVLAVKLQEMFGCAATPLVGGGRLPVTLHLNSPAGRPLQVTQNLASFWKEGYAAVRAEMRGRYPKHPWPENPLEAPPTRHTKARMGKKL